MSKYKSPKPRFSVSKNKKRKDDSSTAGYVYVLMEGASRGNWKKIQEKKGEPDFLELAKLWEKKRKQKDRRWRKFLKKEKEKLKKQKMEAV